jgi:broad specificity phosphatase PhoE
VRVTFVRHGESQSNSDGRWQGHGDSPLSDHGHAQAALAAVRLGRVSYARVVSSDLARARDTARALGVEPELDRGLREIDVGRWEGMRRNDVLEQFPEEIAALIRGDDIAIGGGESWRGATVRSRAALDRQLATLSSGDELAVFSHGGVITSMFLDLVGATSRRPQPLGHMVNTAISVARFEADGAVVERYNDATHVPATAPWRRKLFGEADPIVGYLALDSSISIEQLVANKEIFAECASIVTADSSLGIAAETVAKSIGIEHVDTSATDVSFDVVAERHEGRRAIVLISPEEADRAFRTVVDGLSITARFGRLHAGSLSHIARTRSTRLVVDFACPVVDP